jgi:hypothetical protein
MGARFFNCPKNESRFTNHEPRTTSHEPRTERRIYHDHRIPKSTFCPACPVYISYSLLSSLYICRESSTNSPLVMQNKPNLLDTQMSVSSALAKTYENNLCPGLRENKPNSKPIKPNTNPKQTQNKPKTNPIKPNLVRRPVRRLVRRSFSEVGSFSEDGSLGEGGFKRDTLLLCGALSLRRTSPPCVWRVLCAHCG